MKKTSARCQTIYEPLQRQCIHMQNHDGPHACYHQDDLHLWHDDGGIGAEKIAQKIKPSLEVLKCGEDALKAL